MVIRECLYLSCIVVYGKAYCAFASIDGDLEVAETIQVLAGDAVLGKVVNVATDLCIGTAGGGTTVPE